nr:hypothetical protein [Tanacetum cinerariifolium]
MSATAIKELIAQRVAGALATYDVNQNSGNGNENDNRSHDTEIGAVGLAHWIENIEYVFHISNCVVECHVKYATCTLLGGALTLWNSHVRTVGYDATYEMPWKTLMKMMNETYYPRSEIKKWSVMASKPKMLQEAIELARSLMDQKVLAYVTGQADNKRRMDNNPKDNHAQQPPYKRQNVARAYSTGSSEKKEYARTLPL